MVIQELLNIGSIIFNAMVFLCTSSWRGYGRLLESTGGLACSPMVQGSLTECLR
jgi:hypothetical protein